MALVIGLTGSIASGKSTISKMFQRLDIPVVDADQISREVVEPGESAYQEIVNTFGKQVLAKDLTLDRKRLGQIVFADEKKRKQLNAIIHPEVRKEMLRQRDVYQEEEYKAIVLDIPLLFESGLTHFVDRTLVVYVDEGTQLRRLMERDQSVMADAKQRIDAQMPVREKAEMADAVINNNGTVEESFRQLKGILSKWKIV